MREASLSQSIGIAGDCYGLLWIAIDIDVDKCITLNILILVHGFLGTINQPRSLLNSYVETFGLNIA